MAQRQQQADTSPVEHSTPNKDTPLLRRSTTASDCQSPPSLLTPNLSPSSTTSSPSSASNPPPSDDVVPFAISSSTGPTLPYPDFLRLVDSFASSLSSLHSLTPDDAAFVLCPPSLHVPSSASALSSPLPNLTPPLRRSPTSSPSPAPPMPSPPPPLPPSSLPLLPQTLSPRLPLLSSPAPLHPRPSHPSLPQSFPSAVLFSSGTTGRVKGIVLTHQNFIASSPACTIRRPTSAPTMTKTS